MAEKCAEKNSESFYLPNELSKTDLDALNQPSAVQILLTELQHITERPATERVADVALLARSPVARKAGVDRAWIRAMLTATVDRAERKAREEAVQAAVASGVAAQSLSVWNRVAAGATYSPPSGWLVDEQPPAASGLFRLLWIGMAGPVPVGPLVYPICVDEHGDVRLAGFDRWGRTLETAIGLLDLGQPQKAQTILAQVGAWMDQPERWCLWTQDILGATDLRVADPEPTGIDWQELAEGLRDIVAVAGAAHAAVVGGHRVIAVPVPLVERGLGRKVSTAERRQWAEHGLLVRAPDGRFAGLARLAHRGPPVRCFLLVREALGRAEQQAAAE